MALTHAIRACHDAILVGVGTLCADDPQLTVRLLAGANPMRVVLDTHLRAPIDARALRRTAEETATASAAATARAAVGAATASAAGEAARPHAVVITLASVLRSPEGQAKARALEASGVRIVGAPADRKGRVDLPSALALLRATFGVRSVMVEGGAAVIASCAATGCADRVILTLAPKMLVSGLRPSHERAAHAGPAEQAKGGRVVVGAHGEAAPTVTSLREVCSFSLGDDIVVSGLTISSHGAARRNEAAPPRARL